jgi:hypothetical protein
VLHRKPSPALAILIALLIWQVCAQLFSSLSWGHDSYQMTEWLINYSGGFVRRGLPGTLIRIASNATGIQANYLAIVSGLACYLLLAAWLLRCATATFPVVLVLSCIVMGIPAYQDSIVRKDCLGLLFLLGCLWAERRRLPLPFATATLNLMACLAILCHEAFVFYAIAGFILLRCRNQESLTWTLFIRQSLSLLPAGICFLLVTRYHGSPEQALTINNSWLSLWQIIDPGNPALGTPFAAIEAMGWTTEHGLSLSLYMLTSGFYQPLAWAMVFAISFVFIVLFTDRDSDRKNKPSMEIRVHVTALLVVQLVFISPLFLLGVDYGRWLFLWVVSSMIFHSFHRRAPIWLETVVARIFSIARVPDLLARVPARDWYLLFFGVPVCWNLYNFLVASPVARHLEIIRSWF